MAPRTSSFDGNDAAAEHIHAAAAAAIQPPEMKPAHQPYVWENFVKFAVFHAGAIYGLYLLPACHWYTWIFSK